MIEVRSFDGLGKFRNAWLNARHHFSFGEYHDPRRMGVGKLRVWNDDEVSPGTGFDPHPHRDMEIITYVRDGAITHRDNLGNEGRTEAGDVQVMHAGTGIIHSEYNRESVPTRLFQIWITPDRRGVAPGWGTRRFPEAGSGLTVLASGRPADAGTEALPLNADASVAALRLPAGQAEHYRIGKDRAAYLVVTAGRVRVNGTSAGPRDGVAISGEEAVDVVADEDSAAILVDVLA